MRTRNWKGRITSRRWADANHNLKGAQDGIEQLDEGGTEMSFANRLRAKASNLEKKSVASVELLI